MQKLKSNILIINLVLFFALIQNVYAQEHKDSLHISSHWSYYGETGPVHWSELNPEYSLCNNGHEQSPVDINKTIKSKLDRIKFEYKPTTINLINNGHTIEQNYTNGSSVIISGKKYNLVQFHFHTPSEHLANGKHYDMELHLVHKNDKGELAVVGIFFQIGKFNKTLQKLIDNFPKTENEPVINKSITFNADEFLPSNQTYYHYFGSLTTPPCSENINWNIFKTPVQASSMQINKFKSLMGNNSRSVQKLNDRFVLESN